MKARRSKGPSPFDVNGLTDQLLELERSLLGGNKPRQEALDALPDDALSGSPLLLAFRGAAELRQGSLLRAKELLEGAVKGFAGQTFRMPFLSAMALLTQALMRLGAAGEAETLLRFLLGECESDAVQDGKRRQPAASVGAYADDVPGEVLRALACGCRRVGAEALERELYERAERWFLDDGDTLAYGQTVADRLMRADRHADDAWLVASAARLEQLARLEPESVPYAALASALQLHRTGRHMDAVQRLESLPLHTLSGEHAVFVVWTAVHAAVAAGDIPAVQTLTERAEALVPQRPDDVEAPFFAETARCRLHALRGEPVAARKELEQICSRLTASPFAYQAEAAGELAALPPFAVSPSTSSAPAADEPAWRVSLFGGMRWSKGGVERSRFRWKRKKSQELLVYLLLRPEYSASKEQVLETLFGDEDPDKAANRLYVTLHELKRTLREQVQIEDSFFFQEGKLWIRDDLIEHVDIEQYRTLVRTADHLWADDREAALLLYEKAARLYEEPLPELQYVDWFERLKSVLEEQQARLLSRLGHAYEAAGDVERAESFYQEWIGLRPEQEEAYQALLRQLAAQDRKVEAVVWYRKLENVCRELGTVPLPDTKRLAPTSPERK